MGRLISRILFLVALIIGGVCLILYTMSTTLGEITVKGEQYVRLDQFDVNNYTVDLVWKDGHTDTYKLSELPDEYSVYYDGVLLGGDNLYVEAAVGAHVLEVKFDDYVGKLDHTVTYGYFTSVDMIVTNDAGEVVPYDEMSKTYSISYDGKAHSFEFLNCPDGVSIEYYAEVFNSVTRTYEEFDGTQFTDAGKYKLTATLSHPGYDDKDQNRVQTKFLEIGKKQISVSVDSQSFAFTGNIVTKDINGKEVAKPKFNGVIGNYVPTYTINYYDANKIKVAPDALSEIGTYSVKIESTDSNYAFSYDGQLFDRTRK